MAERHPVAVSDARPLVTLPGGDTEIGATAAVLGRLLRERRTHFVRDGVVVRLTLTDRRPPRIATVKPVELASDLETVALFQKKSPKDELVRCICTAEQAALLLNCQAFKDALPRLNQVSACALLHERDGELRVITGYDAETGVYALGEAPPDMPTEDAVELLASLLDDFNFASPGDRSRAIAALITPALVLGDFYSAVDAPSTWGKPMPPRPARDTATS